MRLIYVYVFLILCIIECWYVCVLVARAFIYTHVCLRMNWHVYLHYLHKFQQSVDWKCWEKGRERKKGRVREEEEKDCCNQIFFSTFMVAVDLFWFEYEMSVLWGILLNDDDWRSRDELIRDVLLWIPTHGRAKAGRPSTNVHSAAMWGYRLLSWRPT